MDSHVAGVCAGHRSPVPGFWACTAQKQHLPCARATLTQALPCGLHPCRLRLVESYRGLTAGLRSLLHPRQAWGLHRRMTSFTSAATLSHRRWRRGSEAICVGPLAMWWQSGDSDPSPWSNTAPQRTCCSGAPDSALRRQSLARRLALRGDPTSMAPWQGWKLGVFPKRN